VLELLALALLVPIFMRGRRRLTGCAVLVFALGLAASPRSFAEGHWYIGGSAGATDAGLDASDYRDALADEGIAANHVQLDDTDVGWKVFGGYNFNDYIGLEAGYTDLGEMKSSFGTTVAPGDIQSVVNAAARVHPFFAAGATFSVVGKVPLGERFELFGKVGAFVWDEAEAETEVTSPGDHHEHAEVDHDGSDVLFGAGIAFALGGGWHVRGEWERYQADDQDLDLISFGVERRIPRD
jgi:OOP family OmpA-OmpF porin